MNMKMELCMNAIFHYIVVKNSVFSDNNTENSLGLFAASVNENCQTEKWKENVSRSEVIYGYFPQGYIF